MYGALLVVWLWRMQHVVDGYAAWFVGQASSCVVGLDPSEVIMNSLVLPASQSRFPSTRLAVFSKETVALLPSNVAGQWVLVATPDEYRIKVEAADVFDLQYVMEVAVVEGSNVSAEFQGDRVGCEHNRRAFGRKGDNGTLLKITGDSGTVKVWGGWATGHEAVTLTDAIVFRMEPIGSTTALRGAAPTTTTEDAPLAHKQPLTPQTNNDPIVRANGGTMDAIPHVFIGQDEHEAALGGGNLEATKATQHKYQVLGAKLTTSTGDKPEEPKGLSDTIPTPPSHITTTRAENPPNAGNDNHNVIMTRDDVANHAGRTKAIHSKMKAVSRFQRHDEQLSNVRNFRLIYEQEEFHSFSIKRYMMGICVMVGLSLCVIQCATHVPLTKKGRRD